MEGESGDPDNDVEDNPSEFNSMSDANDANSNRESAIVPTVKQSNYTAVLRGTSNSRGVGLVEVYNCRERRACRRQ